MGVVGFGVGRTIFGGLLVRGAGRVGSLFRTFVFHQRRQRFALHFFRDWYASFFEDRRRYVDQACAGVDATSGGVACWELEQQRHVQSLVVEKNSVRVLAVSAERLAVVGHDRDQGFIVEAVLSDLADQLA